MKLATVSLTAVLLASSAHFAFALPAVDDAAAAKLAQQIDEQLQNSIPPDSGATLDGKTVVKPEGSSFSFTLPAINGGTEGTTTHIGVITGTLTPIDDTDYRVTATLPTPLVTITNADKTTETVSVATQDIKGVWRPEHSFWPEMNATLGDIAVRDAAGTQKAGLKTLSINGQNTLDAANKLSGNATIGAHGLSVIGEGDSVAIGDIQIKSAINGLDFTAWETSRTKLLDMRQENLSPEATLSQLPDLFDTLSTGSGTGQFSAEIKDISVGYGAKDPATSGSWKLSRAHIESDSKSAGNGLTDLSFSFGHDGLTMQPAPSPTVAALVPLFTNVKITMANVPFAGLFKLGAEEAAKDAAATKEQVKPAADATAAAQPEAAPASEFPAKAKALLAASKTELNVAETGYKSAELIAGLSAHFVADAQAKRGATGVMDAKFAGLDELITKLGQAAQATTTTTDGKPQAQPDPMLQNVLMGLTMLQMQGQLTQGNPSSRNYHFELTQAGNVKLNGVDFGLLSGMAGGAAEQEEATPAVNLPPAKE